MQKLRDQYEAIGQAAIDKVKFTDEVVFEVSFGIVPDPTKNGMPTNGWWFILTLKHNMLLGRPPLIASVPIPSSNLDAQFVAAEAVSILEEARQERDKLNAEPVAAQSLPAGLRGKKL